MPLTIAVLGANGRLGSAVARAATARGHAILAITRAGAAPHAGPGVVHRAADAMDPDALTRAVEGAEVVFNGLNPPYDRWARTALPMARNVIDACAGTGARHLFPGNVYNFGSTMPPLLAPDTPQRPDTRKGRIRVEMEALFEAAAREDRVRTRVVRAGDFFGGPVPGSWFDLVVAAKIGSGRVTYPGPRDVPHAWAYLPDLAERIVDRAERDDGPAFATETFAGHAPTGAELHAALERATGRSLEAKGLPWTALRLMGLVHPMSREVAEMRDLWRLPHALAGEPGPTTLDGAVARALSDLGGR